MKNIHYVTSREQLGLFVFCVKLPAGRELYMCCSNTMKGLETVFFENTLTKIKKLVKVAQKNQSWLLSSEDIPAVNSFVMIILFKTKVFRII